MSEGSSKAIRQIDRMDFDIINSWNASCNI
jgi:hypothetical protein